MLEIWIAFSIIFIATTSGDICGRTLLRSPSGRFSSPFYPENYSSNTKCEWVIEVENGHIVQITFDVLEVGPPILFDMFGLDFKTDYVRVYEDNTIGEYFHQTRFGNINKVYRSTSNKVNIIFSSDNFENFKGFNASYDSWNAVDYCDKNTIGRSGRVNVENSRCIKEIKNDFYSACFVSCYSKFVLTESSKVTCKNGVFEPEKPCSLIPLEAELCDKTNLKYCLYSTSDLVDYFLEKDLSVLNEEDIFDEQIDLDIFPNPPEEAMITLPGQKPDGGTPSVVAPQLVAIKCFDNLIKYSYCIRKKNKDYAFSCRAFLKIKKLKKRVAKRKTDVCYRCRAIDCSAVIYL